MISINLVNQYDQHNNYSHTIEDILKIAYDYMDLKREIIINIILVNDTDIRQLNRQFRNMDYPTDVLSFENTEMDNEIGDVFISLDKTKSQAEDYSHSFERELAFLSLHGFLHCLGYDHLTESDELKMFKLQKEIMNKSNYSRRT